MFLRHSQYKSLDWEKGEKNCSQGSLGDEIFETGMESKRERIKGKWGGGEEKKGNRGEVMFHPLPPSQDISSPPLPSKTDSSQLWLRTTHNFSSFYWYKNKFLQIISWGQSENTYAYNSQRVSFSDPWFKSWPYDCSCRCTWSCSLKSFKFNHRCLWEQRIVLFVFEKNEAIISTHAESRREEDFFIHSLVWN